MAKTLVMTFKNEAGQTVNVRVRYPKETLTGEEVAGVMNTILARNIFPTAGGDLVEALGAYIEETNRTGL